MSSAPEAPDTPDYVGAARQTANSNLNFNNLATVANRINQQNANGSISYTKTENFNQAAFDRAMADWSAKKNVLGQTDPNTLPNRNEFVEQKWTQTDTLNPVLQNTLTNQQLANNVLNGADQTLAQRAKESLLQKYDNPNLNNYLNGVPQMDTSRVSAPTNQQKVIQNLDVNLDKINTTDNQKVGQFKQSAGSAIDSNIADNQRLVGLVQNADKYRTNANIDTNVSDNVKSAGGVKTYDQMNGQYKTDAKVNTNFNPNAGTVQNINNFNGRQTLDTNVADNLAGSGSTALAGNFSNGNRLDQNLNSYLSSVKSLNQDGSGQVGDFKNTAGDVRTAINSGAKLDGSMTDNLAQNKVNMNQQTFNDGGSRVNTAAPVFDESVAKKYSDAAYASQMAYLRDELSAQTKAEQNKLALMGLSVDSEASRAAMGNVYNSQGKQLNQLVNQSILTGAQIARDNYGAKLSGFQAGNQAEAQRFSQAQSAFNTNQAANQQAFNNTRDLFNTNNSAQQQQFQNDATNAQFANSAQQQKFNQINQGYANQIAGKQFNQSQINDVNAARQQALNNGLTKFNTVNNVRSQQFAQDNQAFQNNLASTNQQNQLQQQKFAQNLAAFEAGNTAKQNQQALDQSAYQQNVNATNLNNQAQAQRFNQAAQAFQLGNDANVQRAALDNQAYANALAQNQQNAALVAQQNAAQQQKFTQAMQQFDAGNQANVQRAALDNQAFQNSLASLAANNQAQNQRFNQSVSSFEAANQAAAQQYAQDQANYNAQIQRAQVNAALQAQDNQAAMLAQQFRTNNLNFYNQGAIQNNLIAQQQFENQIAAQNQNNAVSNAAFNTALTKYNAQNAANLDNRYRALNEYNALMQGGTPVNATTQYQNYAQAGATGGVDYASAAAKNAQAQMQQYQAGVAQANATNQSLVSLGAMAMAMSDENLKKNIQKTGQTESGRTTYSWDWNKEGEKLGYSGKAHGVIAQENKDISTKDPLTGYLMVDYSRVNTKKKG